MLFIGRRKECKTEVLFSRYEWKFCTEIKLYDRLTTEEVIASPCACRNCISILLSLYLMSLETPMEKFGNGPSEQARFNWWIGHHVVPHAHLLHYSYFASNRKDQTDLQIQFFQRTCVFKTFDQSSILKKKIQKPASRGWWHRRWLLVCHSSVIMIHHSVN